MSFALLMASVSFASSASAATPSPAVIQLERNLETSMLSLLNSERAANHLPALVWSTALHTSSLAHDQVMAKYNLMAHQCSGEASPGTRITKAGYQWRSWGENIGWTSDETVGGIQAMEKQMYNEKAPDNGHRLNILGKFTNVATDVYVDPVHHIIWYTQDFGLPL